jgi:hypothetical protein
VFTCTYISIPAEHVDEQLTCEVLGGHWQKFDAVVVTPLRFEASLSAACFIPAVSLAAVVLCAPYWTPARAQLRSERGESKGVYGCTTLREIAAQGSALQVSSAFYCLQLFLRPLTRSRDGFQERRIGSRSGRAITFDD